MVNKDLYIYKTKLKIGPKHMQTVANAMSLRDLIKRSMLLYRPNDNTYFGSSVTGSADVL